MKQCYKRCPQNNGRSGDPSNACLYEFIKIKKTDERESPQEA